MRIGGVLDYEYEERIEGLNIPLENGYINAGVLLMDLQKWRTQKIPERLMQIYDDCDKEFKFHDQDLINLGCNGEIDFSIPYVYNALALDKFAPKYIASKEVVVVHYTGGAYRRRRKDLVRLLHIYYDGKLWEDVVIVDDSPFPIKVMHKIGDWLQANIKPAYTVLRKVYKRIKAAYDK